MKRLAIVSVTVFAFTAAALGAAQTATPAGRGPAPAARPAAATKPLDIYVVDTEGGKAALWIMPSGETVLIDSGNPPQGGVARDTDRLMEAVTAAGVTKIDYLISTHYHVDHIGGMQELAKRIPILNFVDHGATVEGPVVAGLREQVAGFQQTIYPELYGKGKHIVVKPGDKIPVAGVDWRIVSSAGNVLKTPIVGAPGAGRPNPACAETQPKEITGDPENGQSVGSVITFGQFRAADFGDLLWNREIELVCPNNPLGTIDLYMVTHHGLNQSNSPAIVHALRPRAAVMQNGTGKGAAIEVMQTLRSSQGLEDIWQLHWGFQAGLEHNSPGVFIANVEEPAALAARLTAPARGGGGGGGGRGQGGPGAPGAPGPAGAPGAGVNPAAGPGGQGRGAAPGGAQAGAPNTPPQPGAVAPPAGAGAPTPGAAAGAAPGAGPAGPAAGGGRGGGGAPPHTPAYWIKISARADGSFTITNSRNAFSKTYEAHPATGGAARGR